MFTYLEHGGANTLSSGWINSQLQFHVMVNGPKTQLPYRSIMTRVRKQIYWRNNVAPIGIDELFLTHSGSAMVSNFSKEKLVTTDTERTTDMTFKGLQLWQEYVHPEWVFSCNDIGGSPPVSYYGPTRFIPPRHSKMSERLGDRIIKGKETQQ